MSVSKHDQSWTLRLGTSHPGSPELGQRGLLTLAPQNWGRGGFVMYH